MARQSSSARRHGPMRWLAAWLLIAACLPWTQGLRAQPGEWNAGQPGSELEIALLTFGPGEITWERFGHNAIVVSDAARGTAISYNYGIFDFDEEDFALNFLRGRMYYRIDATRLEDDLAFYRSEGRSITRQHLNFSPAQRVALDRMLRENVRPENAKYRYEYFTSNCSTKVRDALDATLGGALHRQLSAPSRGYTFRLHADSLLAPEPALMLPMDAGLGPFADRRLSFWDESFVPMKLMEHVRALRVRDDAGNDVPLVADEQVLAAQRLPSTPPLFAGFPLGFVLPSVVLGLTLAGLLLVAARRRSVFARRAFATSAILLSLVFALAGFVLLGLWLLTEHESAWRNQNLLLLDPLCLLLVPTWWRARRRAWHVSRFARVVAWAVLLLALFAFAGKVLPGFAQDNLVWIALLLPSHVAMFIALRRGAASADAAAGDHVGA